MTPLTPQERYRKSLDKVSYALRSMQAALRRGKWDDAVTWQATVHKYTDAVKALQARYVVVGNPDDVRLIHELVDRIETEMISVKFYSDIHHESGIHKVIDKILLHVAQAIAAAFRVDMHQLPAEESP